MAFRDKVYHMVEQIPKGKVATYGQIAFLCGKLRAARAVGNALHENPFEGCVPCHRVVNAKGELSGAFAFGGGKTAAGVIGSGRRRVSRKRGGGFEKAYLAAGGLGFDGVSSRVGRLR